MVVSDQLAQSLCVVEVELGDLRLEHSQPSSGHHLAHIKRANFLRLFDGASPVVTVCEHGPWAGLVRRRRAQEDAVVRLLWNRVRVQLRRDVR